MLRPALFVHQQIRQARTKPTGFTDWNLSLVDPFFFFDSEILHILFIVLKIPGVFRHSFEPGNFDFLFQRLEFKVGGDEFSLLFFGQRGGEGVGEAEVVFVL